MIEGRRLRQARRCSLFYPFDFVDAHVMSCHVTSLSRFPVLPPYRAFAPGLLRQVAFVRRTQSSSQLDCSKSKTSTMSSLERDQLGQRGSGDAVCAGLLRGLDHIRDPQLNKVSYCAWYCTCHSQSRVWYREINHRHEYLRIAVTDPHNLDLTQHGVRKSIWGRYDETSGKSYERFL